jgi:hypothetical protein
LRFYPAADLSTSRQGRELDFQIRDDRALQWDLIATPGGYKQSGLGHLNGIAAIDDFIEYKTIVYKVDLTPKA